MNHSPASSLRRHVVFPLLLLALASCGGCASLPKPTASVTGVRLADLTPTSATLDFAVAVENHYPVALPLVGLDYSLARDGKPFLTGHAPLQGTVAANGSTTVSLPAALDFARLFAAAQDIRPGTVLPYEASLDLSLSAPVVGKITLPLKKSGQLPIPAIPEVELTDVQWKGLDFNRAEAVVHLRVRNTNSFALDVTRLSLGLTLGGHTVASAGVDQPTPLPAGGEVTLAIPNRLLPEGLGIVGVPDDPRKGGRLPRLRRHFRRHRVRAVEFPLRQGREHELQMNCDGFYLKLAPLSPPRAAGSARPTGPSFVKCQTALRIGSALRCASRLTPIPFSRDAQRSA